MGLTRLKTRFAVGVALCLFIVYVPTLYSFYAERRHNLEFKAVLPPTALQTVVPIVTKRQRKGGHFRYRKHEEAVRLEEQEKHQNNFNLTSMQYYSRAGNNSYFCLKSRGRLGSALSHLATLHAIIRETNRKPVFCPKNGPISVLRDSFRAIIRPYEECFKKCSQIILIKSRSRYDPTLIPRVKASPSNVSIRLPGSIFSWKYFDKYKTEIRSMYRIHDIYLHYADKFINSINATAEKKLHPDTLYVCVHIRRTDRLGKKDSDKGYVFPGLGYLKKAIKHYRDHFQHPYFIVCSDDKKWCTDNLNNQPDMTFSNSDNYKEDFAILSRCNHSIITFGHFSWWGGYLAGGNVVYPTNATKPGSHYAVKDMDRMPDSWIAL